MARKSKTAAAVQPAPLKVPPAQRQNHLENITHVDGRFWIRLNGEIIHAGRGMMTLSNMTDEGALKLMEAREGLCKVTGFQVSHPQFVRPYEAASHGSL